jgi:hypothetical protein
MIALQALRLVRDFDRQIIDPEASSRAPGTPVRQCGFETHNCYRWFQPATELLPAE